MMEESMVVALDCKGLIIVFEMKQAPHIQGIPKYLPMSDAWSNVRNSLNDPMIEFRELNHKKYIYTRKTRRRGKSWSIQ